jgi:hypothetical protein
MQSRWYRCGVIDITDPLHPHEAGGCGSTGWDNGVAVSGDHLYLATSGDGQAFRISEGLLVFDISVLANPQRVSTFRTGEVAYLAVSGDYAYVAEGPRLQAIDISNPAAPQRVGEWSSSGPIQDVAVSGNYAYVAAEGYYDSGQSWYVGGGLQVIDIRNPSAPLEVSRFNTNGSAYAVAVSGRYAYLVGSWREGMNWLCGLQVIDVSDPSHPQRLGSLQGAPCDFAALAVSGSFAYVACWGLEVIDISNPASPQRVGAVTDLCATDMSVSGHYAYVADPWYGLHIIDISNPAAPQPVGAVTNLWATAVSVSGNYAYVADGGSSLHVLDISDPANPHRVGGNSRPTGRALAVAGNMLYAAGDDGLVILNTYQPPPRIESTEFGGDGFRLIFRGEVGRTIRLQRSPDLKTWEDWVILTATGDSQAVADPSADSHPCQFYRLVGQ